MDTDKRFVTLAGECFEAEFEREQTALPTRIGSYFLFRLHDVRGRRGERLVSVFRSEQIKLLNPNYAARVEFVRINVIRRAFDSGKLSFDEPYDEHTYKPLEMNDSDLQQQRLVSDPEIRQFMMHKAYWLSYRHTNHPGEYPVNFETPEDLDYLGATQTDIRRNVLRLRNQGMLDKVLEGFGRPTEELIAAYESKQGTAADTETRDTLHAMPTKQPAASHRGLSIFISHSSKDADLALALIDLLKAGLGLMADQIRCSSVDGYRLPVGVNTEGKLREEVNAAKVVVGLITLSSLSSYYVMFELGARWGANLFLAPLLAGVKGSELSGPLSLLNALSASSEAQLHQLLADIANHIGLRAQPAASYLRNVSAVKALADAVANPTAAWDIGEKTNHLHKEHRGKEQVLSAMTPHQNVRRSEVAKLLKMSEDEVLQALRVLREEDKVISLDVDEEPKETFWTRI